MFVFSLGEVIYLIGFLRFLFVLNHFLLMLLSIEIIIIGLYFMFAFYIFSNHMSMNYLFFFLSMMIIEGVFGLCILVYLSRNLGDDSFMFNFF